MKHSPYLLFERDHGDTFKSKYPAKELKNGRTKVLCSVMITIVCAIILGYPSSKLFRLEQVCGLKPLAAQLSVKMLYVALLREKVTVL